MEKGFVKADSDNLPMVDSDMVNDFYVTNTDFLSSEVRNVKTKQSTREAYGDSAIGYVQVRRVQNICTVLGRITPEHKVTKTPYHVEVVFDEEQETVLSCKCKDCSASEGGCKHGVSFLFWLHRRSAEPAVTATKCYWKKASPSKIGEAKMDLQSLVTKEVPILPPRNPALVPEVVAALPTLVAGIFDTENEIPNSDISIYQLYLNFRSGTPERLGNADSFINFMKTKMSDALCLKAEEMTRAQSKSKLWYELKFARVTASRLYEAAKCKTVDGSLVENILGAAPLIQTEAVSRGQRLESLVIEKVAKLRHLQISKAGLFLNKEYPCLGASPDGLTKNYCIEVKCPSKEKSFKRYVVEGSIQKKFYYQMQLQMFFSGRKEGLFCVASPDFETTGEVSVFEVKYNREECEEIICAATEFWKKAIYSAITKM